jgi:prepilin-type N-terminal cleavage/methylation domain-containing protein
MAEIRQKLGVFLLRCGFGAKTTVGISFAAKCGREANKSQKGVRNMFQEIRKNRAAFTLVEIMIVVAIIGLLAALAIPGFVKARKQSQGRRVVNDARQLDAAIDQWALENGKSDGYTIVAGDYPAIASYLKNGMITNDVLGRAYDIKAVGTNQLKIADQTKTDLQGVGIDWGSY